LRFSRIGLPNVFYSRNLTEKIAGNEVKLSSYVRSTFKLVAVDAADETEVTHVRLRRPLHIIIIIIIVIVIIIIILGLPGKQPSKYTDIN